MNSIKTGNYKGVNWKSMTTIEHLGDNFMKSRVREVKKLCSLKKLQKADYDHSRVINNTFGVSTYEHLHRELSNKERRQYYLSNSRYKNNKLVR